MHCIRLARAFTDRTKLLKFEGNFHGYHDQVMYAIGTPVDKLGPETAPTVYPGSTGMPEGLDRHLVIVPYNRTDLFEEAFRKHAHELAAVVMEPVYYNAGCIIPSKEFMATVRIERASQGVLLMFDEVLSAFRMGAGGAQDI
jgi:glutamate-1-semialdehyde 2,1-aminomutase